MFCVTGGVGTGMEVALDGYVCFAYELLSFQSSHIQSTLNTPRTTMSRKGEG